MQKSLSSASSFATYRKSYKNSLSSKIINLSQNLFQKLQRSNEQNQCNNKWQENLKPNHLKQREYVDSLESLCLKAQELTKKEQNKINQVKKKIHQKQSNTFLTGTNTFEPINDSVEPIENLQIQKYSEKELFRNIEEQPEYDDLAEIRKLIKQTDKNIGDCKKKIVKTQKNIKLYFSSLENEFLTKKNSWTSSNR